MIKLCVNPFFLLKRISLQDLCFETPGKSNHSLRNVKDILLLLQQGSQIGRVVPT